MHSATRRLCQETLASQLQRGKVDAYLLTQGIEQAGNIVNQVALKVKTAGEYMRILLGLYNSI